MIISDAPEDYKETLIFKKLLEKSSPSLGLTEKVITLIKIVKPLQELIIAGPFRDYTLHNPNHSKKLLHLTQYVVADSTLDSLSALELTLLIMSFYIHDLGMSLTTNERDNIISSNDFVSFLNIRGEFGDKLNELRQVVYSTEGEKLKKETAIYQIQEAALAEFIRPRHANKDIYTSLLKRIKSDSSRQDLFEISGASFERELIEICVSHNLNSSALLETNGLHQERFARELIVSGQLVNMQFCSAILRLVDILDFDRERTPISLFNALGINHKKIPGHEVSLREWNKHLSVHTINISKDEIVILGDSYHPNIELSIREFCSEIEQEIKSTTAIIKENKREIVEKYDFKLPIIVRPNMRSIGYVYKEYSIKLNEPSVINLLMGENLYVNSEVVIRELVQNSIDACLIRQRSTIDTYNPSIDIDVTIDEFNRSWLTVKDNGIGMDDYVLNNYFFKIGNSYYGSDDFKKYAQSKSISGFNSISRFGIGLISVFMIGEAIQVTTKNNFSPRKDYKTRKLLIDGTNSLAFVTENEEGEQGTVIEVLLKKGFDDSSYIKKLIGYAKENIIRPEVSVNILYDKKKIFITSDNYIQIKKGVIGILEAQGVKTILIDLSRFSNILKGKAIFFLFEDDEGMLSYYDKNKKLKWGNDLLKETSLFDNFSGGSRLTVNGFLMRLKKIGSLFSKGSGQVPFEIDVEVRGIKDIKYDVSRDKLFGNGVYLVRNELYKAINTGLKQLGHYNKLTDETVDFLELSRLKYSNAEPLDQGLIEQIIKILPASEAWPTGIHKQVASELGISNVKSTKYINAMLKLHMVVKPQ